MFSSVQAGIATARGRATRIVLLPGDMPVRARRDRRARADSGEEDARGDRPPDMRREARPSIAIPHTLREAILSAGADQTLKDVLASANTTRIGIDVDDRCAARRGYGRDLRSA